MLEIVPCRYHPFVGAAVRELKHWCAEQGIRVLAHGSLGGAAAAHGVFEDPRATQRPCLDREEGGRTSVSADFAPKRVLHTR